MTSKFNKFMKKIIICSIFITTCLLSLQAQTWQTLNNTNFLRHHTISFSINNMGYSICGNTPSGNSKNVQEYDPVNDSWTDLGDYPGPARGQGIGQTWNGKGYFGFGYEPSGTKLNDLWEFDPISNTFTQLPSCPGVGRTHPALVILNGKIYTGMGSGTTNLSDWWEYDITTQVWTQKTSIPIERHHPYQFILNGYVYVGSGHQSSWYKYDPLNDTWTAVASLDTRVAGTQFNYNGKGYALSGVTTGHTFFATGEFYEYDPLIDSWNILNPHPGNSLWAPASFVINNYAYLYTGTTGATGASIVGTYSSSMYRYQLSNINNSGTDTQVACDSLRWIDNILYTANNTTATDTLTNFANGDSIVTLNLTIINSTSSAMSDTACGSYTWSTDGNTYTSSGLYTSAGTNSLGCIHTDSLVLTITINNVNLFATSSNVSCNGFTDGSLVATATGGISPYQYSLGGGLSQNSGTFSNLTAGSYYIDVTDSDGCTSNQSIIITEPNPLFVNAFSTDISCFGYCDGDAFAMASGGTPPYSYMWWNNFANTPNIIGLCSGIYNVWVEDANSCNQISISDDTVSISEPPPLVLNNTINGCDSVLIGSNYYTISGAYTDTLTSVNGCDSVVNTNLTIGQNTSSYDTLSVSASIVWNGMPLNVSGDYSVTLVNSVGCDSIVNLNLTVTTTGISDIANNKSNLVKITDMLGQETPYRKNTPLFYIYDDGTVEKKLIFE